MRPETQPNDPLFLNATTAVEVSPGHSVGYPLCPNHDVWKPRTPDGTLAGSVLDMAQAVRNTFVWLDVPLDEAVRMASTYPAEFIGLGATHGRIAPGYAADLVALDDQLKVAATWIGGSVEEYA